MSIVKVSCPQNISYNSFSGEINFEFTVPPLHKLIPSKCIDVDRIRVVQTSSDGTTLLPGLRPFINAMSTETTPLPAIITIPYLNPNPKSTLFTAVRTYIGSHLVCNDDYVPCGDTLYKILSRSKEEEKTIESNNAIMPISKYECYTGVNQAGASALPIVATEFQSYFPDFAISTADGVLTKRNIYAMKNLYNLNCNREIELIGNIPSALFKSNKPIPSGTTIKITYVIDNNYYHTNLINYAGSFSSSITIAGAAYANPSIVQLTGPKSNIGIPNSIGVGMLDKFLYLYLEPSNDVINKVIPYDFVNYFGIRKTCMNNVSSDSQMFSFPKNRHVKFIALAFTQIKKQKQCLSDFCIPFDEVVSCTYSIANVATAHDNAYNIVPNQTGEIVDYGASATVAHLTEGFIKTNVNILNPVINLQQLSILFNSKQYPVDQFHFDFSTYSTTASTQIDDGQNDIYRAYRDYCDAFIQMDRCGCLLSFDEWVVSPIFVFTIDELENTTDNTLYVNLWYRNSTVNNVFMYAAAYFYDRLNLKYDHNSLFEGLQQII